MAKYIFIFFFIFAVSSLHAEVNWLSDLDAAKQASKTYKKPILLWIGINSHRMRPMAVTEKRFDDMAKKILCVNLHPNSLTIEQRTLYEVDNSNFSRFYYYDVDFNLLGFEDNPPKSIISYVSNMIKSVEAKEEAKEEEKKEEVVEGGAKELWEKANRYELDEKYDAQITILKQLVAKFPTSTYADLSKIKIEKMQNDPAMKIIMDMQKKEENAARALKSVDIMIKNQKKSDAIKKLESIVKDYADTKAAVQAKDMLEKLKGD